MKRSVWGATACWTLPVFIENTLFQLDARAASVPTVGGEGPILVILQLGGGNDSLNTVIPYTNATYQNNRPNIRITSGLNALGKADMLQGSAGSIVQQDLALHPELTYLHQLWEEGSLAIINGIGYPNPNLSHFTSFDFWHTAEPNGPVRDGWLGRYFDHQCSGCAPTTALEMAESQSLALYSKSASDASIAIQNPHGFTWRDLENTDRDILLEGLYRKLVGLDHPVDFGIDTVDEVLSYVQRTSHTAMFSAKSVQTALESTYQSFPLHSGWSSEIDGLEAEFFNAAALINGGLDTSIYYLHQGGYDTHNSQVGANNDRHANLLTEANRSIRAFTEEMKAQGKWDRVLLFTFSEFGRKVIENGSFGTDHGAAASLFVTGGAVKPGFYGQFPDLNDRIKNHSLKHNIDFRRVYRTVLEKWLQVPASAMNDIFPSQPTNFDILPFV